MGMPGGYEVEPKKEVVATVAAPSLLTVGQLVEKLKAFDQNKEVGYIDQGGYYWKIFTVREDKEDGRDVVVVEY